MSDDKDKSLCSVSKWEIISELIMPLFDLMYKCTKLVRRIIIVFLFITLVVLIARSAFNL